MKVTVKVPATSANLGPGFDYLGLALPIYNTVTLEETVLPGTGIEINVISDVDTIDQLSLDHVPTDENSIVFGGAEEELDIYNAPNKIVRYLENADRDVLISTVINDDPLSKLSTVSRGRTIVDIEPVSDIADLPTLNAYTQRVAAEKKIYQRIIFESAAMPNHESLDCLYIINRDLDINGKFIETAWSLDMRLGGRMKHTCRRAVSI